MAKFFQQDKAYQAFRILQVAFVIAPILAGADKFFNCLTIWSQYLSPFAVNMMHGHWQGFMMLAGVVEIIAGIGMIYKPKIFAYIVSLWLLLIVINLVMTGRYFDIALRDIGLMLAAFALGRLSQKFQK